MKKTIKKKCCLCGHESNDNVIRVVHGRKVGEYGFVFPWHHANCYCEPCHDRVVKRFKQRYGVNPYGVE